MNNTKWTEIFKAFYYDIECSEDPRLSKMLIHWTTKSTNGYIYNDSTWTHFGVGMEQHPGKQRSSASPIIAKG